MYTPDKLGLTQERFDKIVSVAEKRQKNITVVLEDIHDPHNAAAILRTCDAFGIKDVVFIFEHIKKYNPKKVGKTSSSSANKWMDFTVYNSTKECFATLKKKRDSIIVTALDDKATSLYSTKFSDKKIALLFGTEHSGASEYAIRHANSILYIPMAGMVQSLNVSVCAAIVLYEVSRQRKKSGKNRFISGTALQKLIKDYSKR